MSCCTWVASWLSGVLVSLAPASLGAEPPSMSYIVSLETGPRVVIEVRCQGEGDGTTDFELERSWGGHDNDGADVGELAAMTDDGQALEFKRHDACNWTVNHAAGETIVLRYAMHPTPAREDKPGNDYRTVLSADRFQSIGHLGFITDKAAVDEKRSFSVRITGFERLGWQVMSSWGRGEGQWQTTARAEEFKHAMIIAAKKDAGRFFTRAIGENKVGFAVIGDDWGFTDDAFADLAVKIIQTERDFFADHSDPWYLVALTPEGGRVNNGSSSLGGTGLNNSFALFCNTGLNLEPGSPYFKRIANLLAHEFFHHWNGMKLNTAGEEGDAYWFSEGFTNFYARRMLHRAGLLDDQGYAQNLSEAVAAYDGNPFKDAPNARIREEFWKNRDIGLLPYHRGELIALALDEYIRTKSKGEGSLDDFMRWLMEAAKNGHEFTSEQLLARIDEGVDVEFSAMVRGAVVDGRDVRLPETLTSPALRLTTRQTRSFDPGIDMDATQQAKAIVGVVDGSEAHKAGLRNGQKLRGFSVNQGGPNGPPHASVTVEIDGEVKTIEYEAVGKPKPARAYEVVSR